MDNLIVDLDKVLDDFEAEESTPKIPGQEITPSDYAYYVAKNEDKPWDDISRGPITSAPSWNMYQNDDFVKTVSYDIPYTPVENFDLSEADFAPKIGIDEKQTYTGPLDTVDNGIDTEHDKIYIEQKEFSLEDKVVNGNIDGLHHNNDSLNNGHDFSYTIRPKPVLIENVSLSNSYINDAHSVEDNAIDIHSEAVTQNANIKNGNETVKHFSDDDIHGNVHAATDQSVIGQNQSTTEDFKYPVQVVDKFTPISPEKTFIPNTHHQVSQVNSQPKGANPVYDSGDHFQGTVTTTSYSYATQNKIENDIAVSKNNLEKELPECGNSYIMEKNVDETDKVLNQCAESSQGSGGQTLEDVANVGNVNATSDHTEGNVKSDSLSQTVKCDNVIDSSGDGHQITGDIDTVQSTVSTQQTTNISGSGIIGFEQDDDSDNDSGLSEQEVDTYLKQIKDESEAKNSLEDIKSDSLVTDNAPVVEPEKHNELINSEVKNIHACSDDDKIYTPVSVQQVDNTQPYLNRPERQEHTIEQTDSNTELCNTTDLISGTNIPDIVRSSNENSPQRQITGGSLEVGRSLDSPQMGSSPVSGGARPKEPVLRPSSLMGLSKVSLEFDGNRSAKHLMPSPTRPQSMLGLQNDSSSNGLDTSMKQNQNIQNDIQISQPNISENVEQRTMQKSDFDNDPSSDHLDLVSDTVDNDDGDIPVMRRPPQDGRLLLPGQAASQSTDSSRPHSWGPSGSASSGVQQQKRPNSLNIPPRGFGAERSNIASRGFGAERSHVPYTFPYDGVDDNGSTDTSETPESAVPEVVEDGVYEKDGDVPSVDEVSGAAGSTPSPEASLPESPMVPTHSENVLGKVAPRWIPDAEAPTCMGCDLKFTFTKRRHHCRACGKVFCSQCCNMKNRLLYMDNKEARVCQSCHQQLAIAEISSRTGRSPNPNNPSEYCTTIPPSQQANARSPPPTVMVPVVGVLKREGSHKKGEPKQVMFSDGIRPGGDLTELDGSDQVNRIMPRRTSRLHKKVERTPTPAEITHQPIVRRIKTGESRKSKCLIPEGGLPPLVVSSENEGDYSLQENPNPEKFMPQIKDEEAEPVIFAVNANLLVMVKILNLDCCVNRVCWCFTSKGMCTVGQDEVVIVLEIIPDENTVPRDIFCHFQSLYDEAGKGNTVSNMGHYIFNDNFLDSKDHGGMLYICPTFQCLHKLMIPSPPYVFGILLQKWEVPWAKVFPIRLLLRLGAEYRYYPCPLISVRNRKPVFFEIGHTIMNLLADFRNYQYMLPQIKGVTIHMEDKKTIINFPRNRYDELMKVVSSSNEHVMAVGASFSSDADSHLVCIQNDEGNYQTQAINIQNKPRKVTGASFVVFNGALKTSSGLKAKSSIVEDGLMVQITPDNMAALKQAMKDMMNYNIGCGSVNVPIPDEEVIIQWVEDDKNVNVGVKSPIDNLPMDGIESIHIPNATDYMGEHRVIRWTDVFFIQNEDTGSAREPVDLSRLAETLSNAACIALASHLDKLKDASLMKIGLRVTIESEKVGYEIGACGEKLPDLYMNDLDNELIPVIHSAASQTNGGAICLELIFHILE